MYCPNFPTNETKVEAFPHFKWGPKMYYCCWSNRLLFTSLIIEGGYFFTVFVFVWHKLVAFIGQCRLQCWFMASPAVISDCLEDDLWGGEGAFFPFIEAFIDWKVGKSLGSSCALFPCLPLLISQALAQSVTWTTLPQQYHDRYFGFPFRPLHVYSSPTPPNPSPLRHPSLPRVLLQRPSLSYIASPCAYII